MVACAHAGGVPCSLAAGAKACEQEAAQQGADRPLGDTCSTTKSATGATAPEAPPNPPLTQTEKAARKKTRRQTAAAMGTAAALIRHIYNAVVEGL